MKIKIYLLSLIILNTLLGKTINIPNDYSTIQMGLNAADSGDVVYVLAGKYSENITWPDRNGIQLIGQDSSNTIIDGNSNGTVIYVKSRNANIDTTTLIKNFTITNGGNIQLGGGIFIDNASMLVENCKITSNTSLNLGGGLYINNSQNLSKIKNSEISHNKINSSNYNNAGTGIFLNESLVLLTNLVVKSNQISGTSCYCPGLHSINSTIFLENSTFINNEGSDGEGGGIFFENTTGEISNCYIAFNENRWGGGIYLYNSNPKISNVIIYHNTPDGINANPDSEFELYNSLIIKNQETGISLANHSNAQIFNCSFVSNPKYGISFYESGSTINNSTFINNKTAIYLRSNSYPNFQNLLLFSNSIGVYTDDFNEDLIEFNNSIILKNEIGATNYNNAKHLDMSGNYWSPAGPYHPTVKGRAKMYQKWS